VKTILKSVDILTKLQTKISWLLFMAHGVHSATKKAFKSMAWFRVNTRPASYIRRNFLNSTHSHLTCYCFSLYCSFVYLALSLNPCKKFQLHTLSVPQNC